MRQLAQEFNVDVHGNLEHPFPFRENICRTVFMFNLLEHIYNYKQLVDEAHRILQTGGKIIIGVPFLQRVHSDPHDYNRFTKEKLDRLFSSFSNVRFEALDNGPFSATVSIVFPLLITNWIKWSFWKIAKILDTMFRKISSIRGYPIYYILIAEK